MKPETMSSTPTAAERAEKRYPAPKYVPIPDGLDEIFAPDVRHTQQFVYATCIREEVEPREAELVKLRALAQTLGNALSLIGSSDVHSGHVCEAIGHTKAMYHNGWDPCPGIYQINAALKAFEDQGFTPTNTTEG